MANFQKMLKKAQRMQQDVEKAQNELADMEVPYQGNGVEVVAKGDFTLKSIALDEDLAQSQDKEMLEDCVLVAVNGALDKVREEVENKMSGVTGGMNLPGLF